MRSHLPFFDRNSTTVISKRVVPLIVRISNRDSLVNHSYSGNIHYFILLCQLYAFYNYWRAKTALFLNNCYGRLPPRWFIANGIAFKSLMKVKMIFIILGAADVSVDPGILPLSFHPFFHWLYLHHLSCGWSHSDDPSGANRTSIFICYALYLSLDLLLELYSYSFHYMQNRCREDFPHACLCYYSNTVIKHLNSRHHF